MYGNVTIAGGWLQNLGFCGLQTLPWTHGISVFAISSEGLPQFIGLRQPGYSKPVIVLGFIELHSHSLIVVSLHHHALLMIDIPNILEDTCTNETN